MKSTFRNFSQQRLSWGLLALSALGVELCALYFQHVQGLVPCVMCVYERLAILGIFAAGLVGTAAPQLFFVRLTAFALWGISAIWGVLLAIEHVNYQLNPSIFSTCDFLPNFPRLLPLHEWLPWLFYPSGDCGEIVWQFMGYSMPQWLIVSFAIYSILFAIFFILNFTGDKVRR